MAENPIKTPLPADLPEDWTGGQTVAPTGAEVGLSEQHGYNYLMENYPDGCPHPVLKISQYPLPQELVRRMASECKAFLIID